jgi:hypothetical protein
MMKDETTALPNPDAKTSAEIRDSIWWQQENGKRLHATSPMYGINRWEKNGFVNVRVHFGADAKKHPSTPGGQAYIKTTKSDLPSYSWLQEYGIAFDVTPGRPVYCDTHKLVGESQLFRPWLKLFRSTDFGWTMPAAVYAQVEPCDALGVPLKPERPATEAKRWKVRFLREVIGRQILLSDFLDKHVLPDAQLYFPHAKIEDYADPAGKQHDDKSPETSMEVMQTRGLWPRWREASVDEGIVLLQTLISQGDVEIDPLACKTLFEALRSGYVRDEDGFPLKDGFYEHVADAARYLVHNVFRLRPLIVGNTRVHKVELAQVVTSGGVRPKPVAAGGLPRVG